MSIFFLSFIRTWTKLSTLAGHSRTPVAGQGVMAVWGKAVLPCPERTLGGDWTALVFPGTSCKVLHQPLFLLSWSNEEGKKPREFPRRFICQEVILHLSSDTQQFTFARMLVSFLVYFCQDAGLLPSLFQELFHLSQFPVWISAASEGFGQF